MNLESELRDALWVHWAVPARSLPAVPEPLSLDRVGGGDDAVGFVSLVLFRQHGLRLTSLPGLPLSFPQCNLRLLVRDGERVASVFLLRELVPAWVVPVARLLAGQPAAAALFRVESTPIGEQRWRVAGGSRLALTARPGAPEPATPLSGGWADTVAFFRERSRGYMGDQRRLRRVSAVHPRAEAIPMKVEMEATDWLEARLPSVDGAAWARPHSAFMIPSLVLRVVVASDRERSPMAEAAVSSRPAVS